jgi:hypothetical protein
VDSPPVEFGDSGAAGSRGAGRFTQPGRPESLPVEPDQQRGSRPVARRQPRTLSHRHFLDLERQATSAIFYSGEIIHGMLQTEGYAQALLRWNNLEPPEVRERMLTLRLARSAALSRPDRPPLRLWCILSEAALRSGVGGAAVMREQLEHLITMTTLQDNVVVQVLPIGSGTHALMGLLRAKALGHEDSTEFIRSILSEQEES